LVFVTIPAVFAAMPLGNVFMVLFFILTAIAAMGAMLSLMEVPVAFLNERAGLSRAQATIAATLLLALVGSTAALSGSLLANVRILGRTPFDLYDFLTSNLLLPIGGLFIALFVGWACGFEQVKDELTNRGSLGNGGLVRLFFGIVKIVTPLLVLAVLLNGLGVF
jgi:neurotransmitter:Na+ symporter, NSS family